MLAVFAIVFVSVLIVLSLWDVVFFWLPWRRANRALQRGQGDRAIPLLAKAVRGTSIAPLQRDARYKLAFQRMRRGEYNEAVDLLRLNLKQPVPEAEESAYRSRLAEALEGAGRQEEAEAERQEAAQLLTDAPDGFQRALGEAEALAHEQRFQESYAAFERALSLIPEKQETLRAQTLVKLALAAFHAGQPEDALRWSELSLTLKGSPLTKLTAHSVAMLNSASLGRLDAAEAHGLQSLELAQQDGNREQIAKTIAQLAEVQGRRGHLAEAFQRCEQARQLNPANTRLPDTIEMECLRAQGRFAEAWSRLEAIQNGPSFPQPSQERRIRAAYASEFALLSAELGQSQAALQANQRALDGLQNDAKLTTQYRANGVWYLALLGRREEAGAEAEAVERSLVNFPQARGVQHSVQSSLGRAFLALEDWERSRDCWQRYQNAAPDPVFVPKVHYYLGECAAGAGDKATANVHYRQAVATGLDTHYTRLAQQRLHATNRT